MENQIFFVQAGMNKSIVLRPDEIWLSLDKIKKLEKFEKAVRGKGTLSIGSSIPYSAISEVSYNEASKSAKIKYTNKKGKEKKLNVGFDDTKLSNQFGQHLGGKLNMKRSSTTESQVKPLVINGLLLITSIFFTVYFGTIEDTSDLVDNTSGRNRGRGAFVKVLIDAVGPTGVFVVGGLVTLFLAYQLYDRFKNPSNEITFSR